MLKLHGCKHYDWSYGLDADWTKREEYMIVLGYLNVETEAHCELRFNEWTNVKLFNKFV